MKSGFRLGVEKRREAAIKRRLDQMPRKFRPLYRRVAAGDAMPSECIRSMCQQCMGYDLQEITKCTSWACPLWHRRPYQNGVDDGEGAEVARSGQLESETRATA